LLSSITHTVPSPKKKFKEKMSWKQQGKSQDPSYSVMTDFT
jgi:hypothetical protein